MKPLPFEPFKIKMVEKIPVLERAEREAALAAARYNPFKLSARQVTIDGAAHLPNLERPGVFNDAVEQFLISTGW